MERDREAPFLPHPSKARCPTASAGDGEATAQGRPNLSTSLSFVPGFPPAAHAGAVCLLSAARRAARTRQLGSCCMPRAPCPAPHTLGVAANGTPGAESPTWDQQRHPVAGSEGAGVVGHPSPLVLRGNGGSTPDRRSMAQGLHRRISSSCNGLYTTAWAQGWADSAVPPRTARKPGLLQPPRPK